MRPSLMTPAVLLLLAAGSPALADVAAGKPNYPLAKASYPYQVKIHDSYGAEGYGFDCYLGTDEIVVVYWDDFGSKPKEIFRKGFSPDEKRAWAQRLARLPIESMKRSYVDPAVADGLQMSFDFQIRGRPSKRIQVSNADQKELASLCDALNELFPPKLRLRRPQAR